MSHPEPSGPDLDGVVADANAVGLPYVVIGGFSVIANGFVRATKDSDLLIPDAAGDTILRFLERIDATRLHDDKVLTAISKSSKLSTENCPRTRSLVSTTDPRSGLYPMHISPPAA